MKTESILFILQALAFCMETKALDIGSLIPLCSIKDPNLNECVKASGQKLIPLLKDGVPDWKLPPIEPFITPSVTFKAKNPDVDITITYNNVEQTGFSTAIINSVDMDLANGVMTFRFTYPVFTFLGDYQGEGRLFDFKVEGNGRANISVWDCTSVSVIKYHVADDHLVLDSYSVKFSFEKIFLDYTNLLFNGDKELSASASKFINENSMEIVGGFKDDLDKFYADLNSQIIRTFFQAVPYSSLFKDV